MEDDNLSPVNDQPEPNMDMTEAEKNNEPIDPQKLDEQIRELCD